jgi:hypothetical protein
MARPEPKVGRLFLAGGVRPTSNSTGAAVRNEQKIEMERRIFVILRKAFFIMTEFTGLNLHATKNMKEMKRLKSGQNYLLP